MRLQRVLCWNYNVYFNGIIAGYFIPIINAIYSWYFDEALLIIFICKSLHKIYAAVTHNIDKDPTVTQ